MTRLLGRARRTHEVRNGAVRAAAVVAGWQGREATSAAADTSSGVDSPGLDGAELQAVAQLAPPAHARHDQPLALAADSAWPCRPNGVGPVHIRSDRDAEGWEPRIHSCVSRFDYVPDRGLHGAGRARRRLSRACAPGTRRLFYASDCAFAVIHARTTCPIRARASCSVIGSGGAA